MNVALKKEEVERYFQDGFLSGIRLLPEEDAQARFEALSHEVYRLLSQPDATVDNLHYFPWEKTDNPLYPMVDELVRHPQLLDLVSALIGDNILVRNCDIFMKDPLPMTWPAIEEFASKPGGITWHADELTGENANKMLTVWIALTPSTEESGCVRYIQGSHRVPIPDPITDRTNLNYHPERLQHLEECERIPAILSPGELSIHHGNVVHGSFSNFAQSPRMGIAIRYMSASVPPEFSGTNAVAHVRGEKEKSGYQIRSTYTLNWWVPRIGKTGSGWTLHDDTTWYPEHLAPHGDLGSQKAEEDGSYVLEVPCIVDPPVGWTLTDLAHVHTVAMALFPEEDPRIQANLYVPPLVHQNWRGEALDKETEWFQAGPHNRARLRLKLTLPPEKKTGGNRYRLECICALKNRLYQQFSLSLTLD